MDTRRSTPEDTMEVDGVVGIRYRLINGDILCASAPELRAMCIGIPLPRSKRGGYGSSDTGAHASRSLVRERSSL
jgi:hypothetical protein